MSEPEVAEFGLDPRTVRALRSLFAANGKIDRVWLFGSRATGDFTQYSDVDLAVDAPELSEREVAALESRLPETFTRKIDLKHWQSVSNERFRKEIERDRKLFWQPARAAVEFSGPRSIELKDFQEQALARLAAYIDELALHRDKAARIEALKATEPDIEVPDFARKAWEAVAGKGGLPEVSRDRAYSGRLDGSKRPIPNVCLKVPTGGGKTLLAAAAIGRLHSSYYRRHTGMVLWIVPNEAIYRQTRKALSDRDHPYRQLLNVAAAGRVKLLEKDAPLTRADLEGGLCVMLLMLQAAARQSKETLRFFRDRGNVHGFFPREDDLEGHWNLLGEIPNLDVYAPGGLPAAAARTRGSIIKDSLGNVMRLARPMVVIDEGHHSYTDTALRTIDDFNPSFVLELSATPRVAKKAGEHGANILVDVRGVDLERAEMIKLPINVDVRPWPDWQSCLSASVDKLNQLERGARVLEADSARYIRPILLVQVERTGADQADSGLIHADHARAYLLQLGLTERQIAIKSSEKDELAQPENLDLLSPANEVRAIITKQALQEGWDCPFAYVLCALAAGRNTAALTQLVGRILRQPHATKTAVGALDECYVFCHDARTGTVVDSIKRSLEGEGMGDLTSAVRTGGTPDGGGKPTVVRRRADLQGLRIFLPRVTWDDLGARRELAYESDVLGNLDWTTLDADRLCEAWVPSDAAPREQRFRVGLELLDRPAARSITVASTEAQLDRVFIARAVGDLVPNAWLAYELIDRVIKRLLEAGHAEAAIAASSALLIEQLRADIENQRDRLAESLFADLVRAGSIQFSLRADRLDYEIPSELELQLPEKPRSLQRGDGRLVEKSLFEPFYESMIDNGFEAEFACYLDAQSALRWWHRNVARTQYGLQGWRRNKIYPDFVFLKTQRDGKALLVVMETKGAHLKNEDTDYKRGLLSLLTQAFEDKQLSRAGELELQSKSGARLVCDLVFEDNWKNTLNERYFAPS